jgi:hypothetical protein
MKHQKDNTDVSNAKVFSSLQEGSPSLHIMKTSVIFLQTHTIDAYSKYHKY